jgi:aspartate/methionine/tyrosine aminotransferase
MTEMLSDRGRELVANPPFPEYLDEHFRRVAEPAQHPDYIGLCMAENKLVLDLLEAQIARSRRPPGPALGYGPWTGSFEFRDAVAQLLSRLVLGRKVAAEHIAILAGVGSVLETVFYAIADAGQGVLIPTPSYAGFWADLETRNGLQIVPVHGAVDQDFAVTIEQFQRAYVEADCEIRAVLFTSPNNPLGTVYERDELVAVLEWASARGLHVVFDEIYALSTFGKRAFVSSASLLPTLGDRVHVVWGFSKDLAMSGFRCGALISENTALLQAVDALAYWSSCSGDTQSLLASLVSDEPWIDAFVSENQRRLRSAYDQTSIALAGASLPYFGSDAGFFLLCDLRAFLAEPTWEAEATLWRHLLDRTNVNLTPGAACRLNEPGFFRLCFASEPTMKVVEGIGRVAETLYEAGR